MTTIYLDPVRMDATAGAIGEHVNELTTLTADLETACSAAVPASIAGWLAEELRDITVTARMIALLYSVAALDTAQRAQQIQADQSLATAAPSLAATSSTSTSATVLGGFSSFGSLVTGPDYTGGSPLVGGIAPFATSTAATGVLAGSSIPEGFVLGQVAPSSYVPMNGQPEGFMLGASGPNTPLGGYTPSFGGGTSLADVVARPNIAIANLVAPRGLDVVAPGIVEDETGRRGTINATYRNPDTGNLEL